MESARGPPRVKNKAAAPQQISAEQLLREAVDRQEPSLSAPTQKFADLEELHEFQGRKRKEFEDYVRRNRVNMGNWLRYAAWELEQKEYRRARSVFERALDCDSTNVQLWVRYIEAEMKERNINHARNLLDRAVTLLPRVDKIWYKYVYMEEMLGNITGTRQVFERWMSWEPDEAAWSAYIKLETRYGEFERARNVFERFTIVHPEARNWIRWARFEEENGTSDLVREVFGMAIETLGDEFMDEKLFIAYARFESKLKEYERARAIYKYALDRMPRSKSAALHKQYTQFEKQFGDQNGVEDVVLSKRRVMYEEQVKENPKNYDAWFDYARLEEASMNPDRVRDVYERAIAQIPPSQEKRHWRRYIYLWIFYALYEELETRDLDRAAQVYAECLKLIPHKKFTFAKVWILKSQFELRQSQLDKARKTMGMAIGMCPKPKLFRAYIEMELKLFEFLRCRTLYEKWIEWDSSNCTAWLKFAELERGLDDTDRCRAIFELAVSQPILDMPELLWKGYIDFEEDSAEEPEDYDRARNLYERLLEKTGHVKVWISYAHFEINVPDFDNPESEQVSVASIIRARNIFQRAHKLYKEQSLTEERVALLNAWKSFEDTHGSDDDKEKLAKQMPRRVKKRRKLDDDSFEEYMDYVFPADDEGSAKLSKLAMMAQKWKREQEAAGGES
ncbi:Pre-mRNA-splicing factor clf1 [Acrodontium crateriforme]|uniref:Pre-mRNA-splicing factor clf1 n=1 Tax=Acrodontium crateriforme TaxID=150365 RepID=A0AAQ3M1G5_9PEZI|nr:Pre-mRNA-splicing factor clf1 [Acrodontium crateriforme]